MQMRITFVLLVLCGCAGVPETLERVALSATAAVAYRCRVHLQSYVPPRRELTSAGVKLTSAQLQFLKEQLSKMAFGSKLTKKCIPQPGVALKLSGSSGDLDLYVCYQCKVIEVMRSGQSQILAYADFDKVAGEMLSFAKQVFPMTRRSKTCVCCRTG